MASAPRFTVLGHTGFIGSHLTEELVRRGLDVLTPPRDADLAGRDLGTVFYCIGLTADFRVRPFETIEAHVGKLLEVVQQSQFDRLVYLSSTRLYHHDAPGREEDPIVIRPTSPDDLYNISKAMGESLALHAGRPNIVVRLSNVYGSDYCSDNFLPSLLKSALGEGVIRLRTAPTSCKDYINVLDVVSLLIRIATDGRERLYNLASGRNVAHEEIVLTLQKLTGCRVDLDAGAPRVSFPLVDVSRLKKEFDFKPSRLLDDLDRLVALYHRDRAQWITSPST